MMSICPFCNIAADEEQNIIFSNDLCLFIQKRQEVLLGSGLIVPREHRENAFELSEEEWNATFELLKVVKKYTKPNAEGLTFIRG